MPPRLFATVLLDLVAAEKGAGDAIARAQTAVAGMKDGRVKSMLQEAIDEAEGKADRFRASLEQSFNEVMDRASGWYKRRVQIILAVLALALVGAINADSFALGQRLWKDDALRAAVVAEANKAVNSPSGGCSATTGDSMQQAATCVDTVKSFGLPFGWSHTNSPQSFTGALGKILGLLVTAFALMLGAPFWFDLLGKVAHLRGSGPQEKTAPPPPDAATASVTG